MKLMLFISKKRVKVKKLALFLVIVLTSLQALILIFPEVNRKFLEQYINFSFYDPLLGYFIIAGIVILFGIVIVGNVFFVKKTFLKKKKLLNRKRKVSVVVLFSFTIFLLISGFGFFEHNTVINIEERVGIIKMDSFFWWNTNNIDKGIKLAKEMGINTVIISGGGTATYYRSNIVPYRMNDQAHHVFEYIVYKAKEAGLNVYVGMRLSWDMTDDPNNPNDTTAYTNYWALDRDGTPWGTKEGRRNWLSPSYNQVKELYISLAQEILERYNVDGLVLDFIRYIDHPSYDQQSRLEFKTIYGIDPIELNPHSGSIQWFWFEKYMVNKINEIVMEISSVCKKNNALLGTYCFTAIKRDSLISGNDGWFIGQDWIYWAEMGYVDMVYSLSTYVDDINKFKQNLQFSKAAAGNTPIIFGIIRSPDDLNDKIHAIRLVGGNGFFFWDFEDNIFADSSFKERFQKSQINPIIELSLRDFMIRELKKFAWLIAIIMGEISILVMINSEREEFDFIDIDEYTGS